VVHAFQPINRGKDYLEVEAVENLTNEEDGAEDDPQGVRVIGVSGGQFHRSLHTDTTHHEHLCRHKKNNNSMTTCADATKHLTQWSKKLRATIF
jgi:hypothetical protein